MDMKIKLAEDEFIDWIEFDVKSVNPKNIDHILEPTAKFWQYLEIECLAECCGIEAFSFLKKDINSANEKADISNLHSLFENIIIKISKLNSDVITSSQLNQLISKQVFLSLLQHIWKHLK